MTPGNQNGLTRRDFVKGAAAAGLTAAAWPLAAKQVLAKSEMSRVVLIRDPNVVSVDGTLDGQILIRMFDDAVTLLMNEANSTAAWKKMANSDDVVGVKSNVWRFLRTPPVLENHIAKKLTGVGVKPDNIDIRDRGILKNEVFKNSTAIINVRPLRAHHWAGVGGCIKNLIMFDPNPSKYHADACAELGNLFDLPILKNKVRMHCLLMLQPLYNCKGPHDFQKQFTWHYNGLLVSEDPVAVDAIGVSILQAKRLQEFRENRPFTTSIKHIRLADERYGLGNSKQENIELVRIGWEEGILI
ncbi:MAG: DUF362 domain-containing protein [FCB group bacterium]|nr:DUF362 domain-containing protein [FCB group bacterium]